MKRYITLLLMLLLSGCEQSVYSKLEGQWLAKTDKDNIIITFKENKKATIKFINIEDELNIKLIDGTYEITGSANPYNIDINMETFGTIATIITINDNSLNLELINPGKPRPKIFTKKALLFIPYKE